MMLVIRFISCVSLYYSKVGFEQKSVKIYYTVTKPVTKNITVFHYMQVTSITQTQTYYLRHHLLGAILFMISLEHGQVSSEAVGLL
jgi:hypothetical protein